VVKFDNFSVKIIIGASMKVVVSLFTESQFFLAVIADPNHVKLASIVSLGLCLPVWATKSATLSLKKRGARVGTRKHDLRIIPSCHCIMCDRYN